MGLGNVKKTYYYLQRNGLKNTWYAVRERLEEAKKIPYSYAPISEALVEKQKKEAEGYTTTFSIAVPTYRTKEIFLRELIDSLLEQTYPKWELILADSGGDDSVKNVALQYGDKRIRYIALEKNEGIAQNTNYAIEAATGDYVGLLDHDDVLTKDALYEMVKVIEERKKTGIEVGLLYSDEDKCDGEGKNYFEPHIKEEFNLQLLLCNNYFCHFCVYERKLIQKLLLRKEFDGAQDYDLVLRTVSELKGDKERILHVPYVLYHWRCHEASTAQNPMSKQYAYEAGKRAVQDYFNRTGIKAAATHLKHLGFYGRDYGTDIFQTEKTIGACGGKIYQKGKVVGGRMDLEGRVYYEDLPKGFSGEMHRAVLWQDAEALDLRCIRVREECIPIFEETVGISYQEKNGLFDSSLLDNDSDIKALSLAFGRALKERGYSLVMSPDIIRKL